MSSTGNTHEGNSLGSYRIPELDGHNSYPTWKINMMDILHHAKLFKYVEMYLLANVKDDVKEADREALSQIRLHTSLYVKTFIAMAETAKDAWDTLKWEFKVTRATSQVFLLRELYTMCMLEEDNLDTHTQHICSIYQDLKIAGEGLSEGNFIMALLMSLPPSWDNFISSTNISGIDSTDDQKKHESIDAVQACIKTEWVWWKPRNNSSGSLKLNHYKSNKSHPNKSNSECNYCHKKGHWYNECQKWLANKKKDNNKISANVAQGGHTYDFSIFNSSSALLRNLRTSPTRRPPRFLGAAAG